jgi:hypothetical protein
MNGSMIIPIVDVPGDGVYMLRVGKNGYKFLLIVTGKEYSISDLNNITVMP